MKGEDLLRAMTEIEDRYILEADPTAVEAEGAAQADGSERVAGKGISTRAGHRRTPRAAWASAIALAAVLLLAFIGGRSWMRHSESSMSTGPSTGAGTAYEEAAVTEEAMEMEEEAEEEAAFDVAEEADIADEDAGPSTGSGTADGGLAAANAVEEAMMDEATGAAYESAEETADYAAAESVKEESAERGDTDSLNAVGASSDGSADVITAQIYGREVLYRRVEHPAEVLAEAGVTVADDMDLAELAFQIPGTEDWYGIAGLPDERLLLHMEEGVYVLYEAAE